MVVKPRWLRKLGTAHRAVLDAWRAGTEWKTVQLPPAPGVAERPRHYLTLAAAIKNEGRHLAEWIEFHRFVGVERFYLYDNGSTDETARVLAPHCRSGLVQVIAWRNFSVWLNQQRAAYAHALANFGPATRWMAFFDADEFVFPTCGGSLGDVLREREDLPALCVAGINFGTSGHRTPPAGGVLDNYRHGVPMAVQRGIPSLVNVKSIVQPGRIAAVESVHWFRIRGEAGFGYTEHRVPLGRRPNEQRTAMSADVVRYNHYFSRSAEEFEQKLAGTDARGARYAVSAASKRRMLGHIERCAVEDRTIDVVLDRLRATRAPDTAYREEPAGTEMA